MLNFIGDVSDQFLLSKLQITSNFDMEIFVTVLVVHVKKPDLWIPVGIL